MENYSGRYVDKGADRSLWLTNFDINIKLEFLITDTTSLASIIQFPIKMETNGIKQVTILLFSTFSAEFISTIQHNKKCNLCMEITFSSGVIQHFG